MDLSYSRIEPSELSGLVKLLDQLPSMALDLTSYNFDSQRLTGLRWKGY